MLGQSDPHHWKEFSAKKVQARDVELLMGALGLDIESGAGEELMDMPRGTETGPTGTGRKYFLSPRYLCDMISGHHWKNNHIRSRLCILLKSG
jgi:hypothetical protein